MKNIIQKVNSIVVLLVFVLCFLICPSILRAQEITHRVAKGDTLWSICEKYYGDSELWPKLWQINPFITNPHLLNPGDTLKLLDKEPVKEIETVKAIESKSAEAKAEQLPIVEGINFDDLTEINSIGYLSLGKIDFWGTLLASESGRLILDKGDVGFILFEEDRAIKIGDEFAIGNESPSLKHPVTGNYLGHTFITNGKIKVTAKQGLARKDYKLYDKKNVYQIEVTEIYEPIQINDIVIPYSPVSSCVLPVFYDNKDFLGNIVAAKKQRNLLHTNEIVYLDKGFNHGINRGNVFEVVETNIITDPKPGERFYPLIKGQIILPDIPVGNIMVLESHPSTSTAIVLTATKSFSVGAYIRSISPNNAEELLSLQAKCPFE